MKIHFVNRLDSDPFKNFHAGRISPLKIQKPSKISLMKTKFSRVELMRSLFLENHSIFTKIFLTFKLFFFVHIIAWGLNIVTMIIEDFYNQYCFMAPNCFCTNEPGVKSYVLLKTFLTLWIYEIYMIYNSIFFLKSVNKMPWLKILYFLFYIM